MEPVPAPNFSILIKSHENKWVAFSMDKQKILAVARSLRCLYEDLGKTEAIVMRVLPADVGYAANVLS